MAPSAISTNLIARLGGLQNVDAQRLVEQFQSGQISEKQFIASASPFLSLTRSDSGAALSRSARLFGSSRVSSSYDQEGMKLVAAVGGTDLAVRPRDIDFRAIEGMMS